MSTVPSAADGHSTSERALGVAILGAGQVAVRHADAIREVPGVRLLTVADADAAQLSAWTQRHGHADTVACANYQDAFSRDDVDLVIVSLPHRLHCEATLAAVQAGKHVLVEKPMALTLDECDRMIAAASRAGVVLAVGLTHHFRPVPAHAKALLDSGRLGRIAWASETAYTPWRYDARRDWIFDRSQGGGQLLANGVHYIDRLLWTIAGPADVHAPAQLVRAKPIGVSAVNGTYFHQDQPTVRADDGDVLFLRFDTGQAATIHLSGHAHGAQSNAADYVCSHGALRYTWDRLYATDPGHPDDREYHEVEVPKHLGFGAQLGNVAKAIRTRASPGVPGEWGRLVMRVLLAAEESAARGLEVRLN